MVKHFALGNDSWAQVVPVYNQVQQVQQVRNYQERVRCCAQRESRSYMEQSTVRC